MAAVTICSDSGTPQNKLLFSTNVLLKKQRIQSHSSEEGEAEIKTTVSPAMLNFLSTLNCFPVIEIKDSVFLIHYSLNVLFVETLR